MFEKFGAKQVKENGSLQTAAEFNLFFPGWGTATAQYAFGGEPNIDKVSVFGTFQANNWEESSAVVLNTTPQNGGILYHAKVSNLQPGFYEYRYIVIFKNGEKRITGDPCAKYSVEGDFEICGFVIDDPATYDPDSHKPVPINERLPLKDLIIYELFIWDFAMKLSGNKAPVDKVIEKINTGYFNDLGINAIEFMPWTAWPGGGFSWGYDNFLFFSVEDAYVRDLNSSTDKIDKLIELINVCHEKKIHVIMDCVLNHTYAESRGKGFPYYSLYQKPEDCPFLGAYKEGGYFQDFDYSNQCTNLFILDVCKYWISEFGIDGIRLDYTRGFYDPANDDRGLKRLIRDLKQYLHQENLTNFLIILEHIEDYKAVQVCNDTKADGVWYEPSRSLSYDFLGNRPRGSPQIETKIMRMLNSSMSFDPERCAILYHGGNHDHKPLILKAGGRNFWYMIQPYIIALFTCSGAPLLYNGHEFGQDNDMPEHGEPGDRVIPRSVDWDLGNDDTGKKLISFYKKMIGIRNDHTGLRSNNFYPSGWDERQEIPDTAGFGINKKDNIVVYHRWGFHEDGSEEKFYIILNFRDGLPEDKTELTFNVPDRGPWKDLLSGTEVNSIIIDGTSKLTVSVPPNYGAIYYKKYS